MRIGMISPIAWRTPPRHYGPWENVVSVLTEALLDAGHELTLFATGDSITSGHLESVCQHGYEEDAGIIPKVWECLHISEVFERAAEFDVIHNHFDFLPLSYSALVKTPVLTTIHGFSSPGILPVYRKYNESSYYVSISNSDRCGDLDYIDTIYHGIDIPRFEFSAETEDYLLFFGRIHNDKGAREALEIARESDMRLVLAGIIQDEEYFKQHIVPYIDNDRVKYVGSVGPEERSRLLGKAAAMLHPIQFDEPFGLSVVEAMACGTPVIAFNRGSMPEIIQHGRTGFLVETVGEATAAVARLHEIDRMYCRNYCEKNFSAARMANDYIKVYKEIIRCN
ncbi:glycosyltransferase family 4 protein [Spirochaeta dissipatitropha]